MPRVKKCDTKIAVRPPAMTPEGQEAQMIALAMDCAKKQMEEGTASSQIIAHYLKLGTAKEQLELEKLRKENLLLEAKTKAIESSQERSEMYKEALEAFKRYKGYDEEDDMYED